MHLITWKRVGIVASVICVVVGPTYFHLSREDNDKRIARDQYQLCIKQAWSAKEGVKRCNKDLRNALAIARWSSWAQLTPKSGHAPGAGLIYEYTPRTQANRVGAH